MFTPFIKLLREYGVPANMSYVMEFHRGLEKGLADDLDELFLFARLCFVKRVEHMDPFERAFIYYFHGIDIPDVAEGDYELLNTKQFREWLREAVERGELKPVLDKLSPEDLMKKFWDTIREQLAAHHGGKKWVGTGGRSPFGHSGADRPQGIRVHGESRNRSALKVIGERRYTDYSGTNTLKADNIRQALASLKNLKPAGAYSELDIRDTIYETGRNGGEIELVFRRELRDKIQVALLMDNGGSSMLPFVEITRTLFLKARDRFTEFTPYYFHNTIYENIYRDASHRKPMSILKFLERSPETRVLFVGDATMAPEELLSPYGSQYFGMEDPEPSINWLHRIRERFRCCVWLNPIPRGDWSRVYGSYTLKKIAEVIHMEDLTLSGIKRAVDYMNRFG